MVIKTDEMDMVMLYESTTLSQIKCVELGRQHKGVQLVPLSERINQYQGRIGVRRLHGKGAAFTPNQRRALAELRHTLKGTPYEKSTWQLVRSAFQGLLSNKKADLSSVFCSELVAQCYQALELLPSDDAKPSNSYTPAHFARNLPLNHAQLGEVIILC